MSARTGHTVARALLLFLGGCGPSKEQVGLAVLTAAPAVWAVALLLLWPLRVLWQRRHPDLRPSRRHQILTTAAFLAVGLAALPRALGTDSLEWWGVALWAYGTTALGVALLVWRIWLHREPRGAFRWAALASMAVITSPALLLAAGVDRVDGDDGPLVWAMTMWVYGGALGIVPGVLWLGFLAEAGWRTRRR